MTSERSITDGTDLAGSGSTPRAEILSLTGLRIVAAVWVLAFHFHFTPGDYYTQYWQILRPFVLSGALGVDLFFVLSGFVITLTYLGQIGPRFSLARTRSYLWARVCRVWPVHAVVTTFFFGWLLFKSTRVTDGYLAYQTVQPQVDLPHWIEQLLMVQVWHRPSYQGASFVGPAWSLSAEMLAYVCFPLLALALWRLRTAPPLVTGLLAIGCLLPMTYFSFLGGLGFGHAWLLRITGGFLAGAFACLAVRRIERSSRVDVWAPRVVAVTMLEIAVGLWWADWRGEGDAGYAGVVAFLFPVLVGALALSTRGPARLLAARPMVHGGRISFALHLVHIPVCEVFWTFMQWYPGFDQHTLVGTLLTPHVFLATFLLAHLLYRFVEEPARTVLRRREPFARSSGCPGPEQRPADDGADVPSAAAPRAGAR